MSEADTALKGRVLLLVGLLVAQLIRHVSSAQPSPLKKAVAHVRR